MTEPETGPAAVIFDCEYLAVEGSTARFWSGHQDPDPVVIQIGAVRLDLHGGFGISEVFERLILPQDRHGRRYALSPYISDLTGIEERALDERGVSLSRALEDLQSFARGCQLWSWGKDEFLLLALSCYVQSIASPLPVTRFGNLKSLFAGRGMNEAELARTPSSQLAARFNVAPMGLRAHDGLSDALSLAHALRHLLAAGLLSPDDLLADRTCAAPLAQP